MPLACCPDPLSDALGRKAEAGMGGAIQGSVVARGDGWQAIDFICTCGPGDGIAAEVHARPSVSIVRAGTFVCRSRHGTSLLSAGALFLGSIGEPFECSHQHGEGDRCLSFQFAPELFEEIAGDAGVRTLSFERDSIPPIRHLAPWIVRGMRSEAGDADMEEVAYELARHAVRIGRDAAAPRRLSPRHRARVADLIRHMETRLDEPHPVSALARMAGMSRYHLIRSFKDVAGVTPHQWLLRARLRAAAERLGTGAARVTDIALEVGFEDLSNFVRAFRAEFGVSPRAYRLAA